MKHLCRTAVVISLPPLLAGGCGARTMPEPVGGVWDVDETDPAATAAARRKLRQQLPKVEFAGLGFEDAVHWLRETLKLNVQVKWEALRSANIDRKTPVHIQLAGVTARQALKTVLDDVGGVNPLAFDLRGGVVVISTRADLDRFRTTRVYEVPDLIGRGPRGRRDALRVEAAREILHRGLRGEGPGLIGPAHERIDELAEALLGAERRARAEELIDVIRSVVLWTPLDGEPARLSVFDGRLVATLRRHEHRELVRLLAALRGGSGPPPFADPRPVEAPAPTGGRSPDEQVEAALRRTQPKLSLKDVPLGDAIQFLRDASGLSMHVKWEAILQGGVRERRVTVILHDVTIGRALRAILDSAEGAVPLGYIIDQGVVTISTTEDLSRQTLLRLYDVSALVAQGLPGKPEKRRLTVVLAKALKAPLARSEGLFAAGPPAPCLADAYRGRAGELAEAVAEAQARLRADRLKQVIRRHTDGDSWLAPWSTMRSFRGKLAVSQTPLVQRQIPRLLSALGPRPGGPPGAGDAGAGASVGPVSPPPPSFRIPPVLTAERWPAGDKRAIARPVEIFGQKMSRVYVLFLIDSSGSMLDMLDLAKEAAGKAVQALSDEQYVEVLFHSAGRNYPVFGGRLTAATAANRRKAIETFKDVQAQGLTDGVGALRAACQVLAPANGSGSQVIFFLTDGQFADNRAVLRLARRMAEELKVVIHPVAFGRPSPVARRALQDLAEATGGRCTTIGPGE